MTYKGYLSNQSMLLSLSYCPSRFILKPGQFVHINKGRLHAFRKLSFSVLPDHDCHTNLRKQLIEKERNMYINEPVICISVAWDWTYRGNSVESIKREVSCMMECAAINRDRSLQSLGIPEISLIHAAKAFLALTKKVDRTSDILFLRPRNIKSLTCAVTPDPKKVLRGILPSLSELVVRHKADIAKVKKKLGDDRMISRNVIPDSWENPRLCSIDPYGNDFLCVLCRVEVSNPYMHCNGCEELLKKDFNICIE